MGYTNEKEDEIDLSIINYTDQPMSNAFTAVRLDMLDQSPTK